MIEESYEEVIGFPDPTKYREDISNYMEWIPENPYRINPTKFGIYSIDWYKDHSAQSGLFLCAKTSTNILVHSAFRLVQMY